MADRSIILNGGTSTQGGCVGCFDGFISTDDGLALVD